MSKVNIITISSLAEQTSAVAGINANFAALQAAFDNTLSRDGTVPNQMTSSLDSNNNRIINLPSPVTGGEPLRLQDLLNILSTGSITINTTSVPVSSVMTPVLASTTTAVARNLLGIVTNTFVTRAQAVAATIDATVSAVRTLGYTTGGDGGGATYKKLGSPPGTPNAAQFQSADGAWWELGTQIYTPEMFGAVRDGVTDDAPAINNMNEYVPAGAIVQYQSGDYRIKKQFGQQYGIRLRKPIRMLGAGQFSNPGSRMVYDNSYTSTDNVFLIQPPGTDNGINIFTVYGLEIGHFTFVPFAASLGFIITQFGWTVSGTQTVPEYALYARDIIHFDIRTGGAVAKAWLHDLYSYSSGGPGGGFGVGFSINVDCAPTSGGMYASRFERLHVLGGMRFAYIADSNSFYDIRMEGKQGIDCLITSGAVENVFENFNVALNGCAFQCHWASKMTLRRWNVEHQGLQTYSPNAASFDIRNDLEPNGGSSSFQANCITFDDITVADLTSGTQGLATPLTNLIYINNTFSAVFKRIAMYSTGSTQTGIFIDTNAYYTRLDGPITNMGASIVTKVINNGKFTYGWDIASGTITYNGFASSNLVYRKSSTGYVNFGGGFIPSGTSFATAQAGLLTVFTVPVGFQPAATQVFICATDVGYAVVQVSSAGNVVIIAYSGSPTIIFLSNIMYKESTHDNLVSLA